MKRKLFITLALALFAVGAVTTTNVAQNDVSLDDIRVMAMADHTTPTAPGGPEGGGSAECNLCKITNQNGEVTFSCRSTPKINKCIATDNAGWTMSCDNATKCD